MPSVIAPNVVMTSVVAPRKRECVIRLSVILPNVTAQRKPLISLSTKLELDLAFL
jgi:hypothetical protein